MFKYVVAAILGLMASLGGLTSAQAGSQLSVSCAPPTVTFNSVTLNCRTSRPVPMMYNFGTRKPLTGMVHAGSGKAHPKVIGPFPPATSFRYAAVALIHGKWKTTRTGNFRTQNPEPATATVSGGNILLGGSPSFLLFEDGDFCTALRRLPNGQPPMDTFIHQMGENTLAGGGGACDMQNHANAGRLLHQACESRCWWLEKHPQESQGVDFAEKLSLNGEDSPSGELAYFQPIYSCGAWASSFVAQERALRQLVKQGKPVLAVNVLRKIDCLTSQKVAAKFWMAVCAGVKGIGYSPFATSGGNDISAPESIRIEAGVLKQRFAASEPTLFAPSVSASSGTANLSVCAHRYGGVTTVVSINLTNKTLTTQLKVAGTGNRTAWRYSEGSKVKVSKVHFGHGKIHFSVAKYGVNIYVVP